MLCTHDECKAKWAGHASESHRQLRAPMDRGPRHWVPECMPENVHTSTSPVSTCAVHHHIVHLIMAGDAVSSSARGAGFLILLQISSRALTFALNQVLLRFLSPALLGASVQLELFVISAHHFARESLRVACQRQPDGGIQAAINLSYLAVAGGIPIVLGLAQWYLTTAVPDVPYFVEALRVYQVAAIIELCSEPAFVTVQQNMLYKTRAAAEASAVVLKTFATAGAVFWSQRQNADLGVLPFAAGELFYCSTLTVVYLWQTIPVARRQSFSLLPKSIKSRCVKPPLKCKLPSLIFFQSCK